ncbi:hypothetical protein KFE25_010498 [Diacronema lutheri]|uniref:Uncharacterized protein n=1 Tax=Diacronema lutheri TaxID=2081491 RepID=A0A8J5X9G2_DIALT|nr:hypothetical protein KFE25_010498 [Diacronema lutheri]
MLKSVFGEYASLAMIGVAIIAILANSSTIDPEDSIPWEVTLAGTCALSVSAVAMVAKKPEVAYFVMGTLAFLAPTYYVYHRNVDIHNWSFGTRLSLKASAADVVADYWQSTPNVTNFDHLLPGPLTLVQLSLANPNVRLFANATEILHSGIELRGAGGAKTHDYLLVQSPRRVKREVAAIMTLLKVPVELDVWPDGADMSMDLQIASGIVMPHLFSARLLPLEKGAAVAKLHEKHKLRPFLLDCFAVEFRPNLYDLYDESR